MARMRNPDAKLEDNLFHQIQILLCTFILVDTFQLDSVARLVPSNKINEKPYMCISWHCLLLFIVFVKQLDGIAGCYKCEYTMW